MQGTGDLRRVRGGLVARGRKRGELRLGPPASAAPQEAVLPRRAAAGGTGAVGKLRPERDARGPWGASRRDGRAPYRVRCPRCRARVAAGRSLEEARGLPDPRVA